MTVTHYTESQTCPGLHPKLSGQQGERGEFAPLLCAGETPAGALHPALEFSAQETYVIVGLEENHKDDQGDRISPVKTDRVGVVQPGEEKALGRVFVEFSELGGAYEKDGDSLVGSLAIGQGIMVLKQK